MEINLAKLRQLCKQPPSTPTLLPAPHHPRSAHFHQPLYSLIHVAPPPELGTPHRLPCAYMYALQFANHLSFRKRLPRPMQSIPGPSVPVIRLLIPLNPTSVLPRQRICHPSALPFVCGRVKRSSSQFCVTTIHPVCVYANNQPRTSRHDKLRRKFKSSNRRSFRRDHRYGCSWSPYQYAVTNVCMREFCADPRMGFQMYYDVRVLLLLFRS